MNYLNLNNILNRENEENQLIDFLNSENQKSIYVYGELGIGKSFFVKKILQKLQYEIIDLETIDLKSDSFSSICYSQNNQRASN